MQKTIILLTTAIAWVAAGAACSASNEVDDPSPAPESTGGTDDPVTGTGGSVVGAGGTGGLVVDEGVGLTSSVFGSLADLLAAGGGGVVIEPCDYGPTPTCDFTRLQGCCSHLDCSKASRNPDDTYPIEACQGLLACAQANPDCSTATNPFCFFDAAGEEDPNSVCADEVYLASHTDPEGPYAFTLELMKCACGYP